MGWIVGFAVAISLAAGTAMAQLPSEVPSRQAPGGANPGQRQILPKPGEVMSEEEIRRKLREEGYLEVTELRLQGPSYEAKAVKDGRTVNLTVDAKTGSIRSTY